MSKVIIYGIGGYCSDCLPEHDHPLNNVVDEYDLPTPEPTPEEQARQSAIDKLTKLGLTEEEIEVLLASV